MNVWIGRADETVGATSHLHHDYHDNLYCLVQGRKTLVLYGPDDTQNVYPAGALEHLDEAGLIYYAADHHREGQEQGEAGQGAAEKRAPTPHFSRLPAARWEELSASQQALFPNAKRARRMECEIEARDRRGAC